MTIRLSHGSAEQTDIPLIGITSKDGQDPIAADWRAINAMHADVEQKLIERTTHGDLFRIMRYAGMVNYQGRKTWLAELAMGDLLPIAFMHDGDLAAAFRAMAWLADYAIAIRAKGFHDSDIKPDNILVVKRPSGRVSFTKIDHGCVRRCSELVGSDVIVGTVGHLHFAAYDRLSDGITSPGELDHWLDIATSHAIATGIVRTLTGLHPMGYVIRRRLNELQLVQKDLDRLTSDQITELAKIANDGSGRFSYDGEIDAVASIVTATAGFDIGDRIRSLLTDALMSPLERRPKPMEMAHTLRVLAAAMHGLRTPPAVRRHIVERVGIQVDGLPAAGSDDEPTGVVFALPVGTV